MVSFTLDLSQGGISLAFGRQNYQLVLGKEHTYWGVTFKVTKSEFGWILSCFEGVGSTQIELTLNQTGVFEVKDGVATWAKESMKEIGRLLKILNIPDNIAKGMNGVPKPDPYWPQVKDPFIAWNSSGDKEQSPSILARELQAGKLGSIIISNAVTKEEFAQFLTWYKFGNRALGIKYLEVLNAEGPAGLEVARTLVASNFRLQQSREFGVEIRPQGFDDSGYHCYNVLSDRHLGLCFALHLLCEKHGHRALLTGLIKGLSAENTFKFVASEDDIGPLSWGEAPYLLFDFAEAKADITSAIDYLLKRYNVLALNFGSGREPYFYFVPKAGKQPSGTCSPTELRKFVPLIAMKNCGCDPVAILVQKFPEMEPRLLAKIPFAHVFWAPMVRVAFNQMLFEDNLLLVGQEGVGEPLPFCLRDEAVDLQLEQLAGCSDFQGSQRWSTTEGSKFHAFVELEGEGKGVVVCNRAVLHLPRMQTMRFVAVIGIAHGDGRNKIYKNVLVGFECERSADGSLTVRPWRPSRAMDVSSEGTPIVRFV